MADRSFQDRVLRLVIKVNRRAGDACTLGNARQRAVGKPLFIEFEQGSGQDFMRAGILAPSVGFVGDLCCLLCERKLMT